MASVGYATPGSLYLIPTAVTGSSGTLIEGIEENDITLALDGEVIRRRTGVGANAGFRSRMGRVQSARLIVPLRRQDATALKILFSHLTTNGTELRPTGGTASLEFARLPTFALILRPKLTTEKYLYAPNWCLSAGSIWLVQHSETAAQLSSATLELAADRPTNATGPAFSWASSAAIASAFGLSES